jgi:hypothetical protein
VAGGAGAGTVEALAPDRKRERGLYWVPLGTNAHKEGAVVVVGTAESKNPEPQDDVRSRAVRRKGTVMHHWAIQNEQP